MVDSGISLCTVSVPAPHRLEVVPEPLDGVVALQLLLGERLPERAVDLPQVAVGTGPASAIVVDNGGAVGVARAVHASDEAAYRT